MSRKRDLFGFPRFLNEKKKKEEEEEVEEKTNYKKRITKK
jgi:hypothetical protein